MFRKTESGQTLIMALALLAVGSLLVLPVLTSTFTNLNYNQTIECRTLNDYAADAGIQYATCKIYNDPGTYTTSPISENFTINDRTVYVNSAYVGGGLFSVNSTAYGAGCGKTTITSVVNLSHGAFAYALAAMDYLYIDNASVDTYPNPGIGADIHSNDDIEIIGPKKGDRKVYGDATAVTTIIGEEYIADPWTAMPGSENITFPGTNAALYQAITQEGGTHVGDLQYSGGGTYSAGPLYITGDLIVDAWTVLELTGPLYILGSVAVSNGVILGNEHVLCEGDINITGGAYYGSEFIPVITSVYGDITVAGPGVAETVLYAPTGTVSLSNVQLFGAVGGVQVLVSNAYVWYSEELHGRSDLPGSELYPLTYSYD